MSKKDHFDEDDEVFDDLGFEKFDDEADNDLEDVFEVEGTPDEDSIYESLKNIKNFEDFDDLEDDDENF